MMIECVVKTGQTVESIENTRFKRNKTVVTQITRVIEWGGVDVE